MTHAILAGGNEGLNFSIYFRLDDKHQPFYFNYETDFTGIVYTCTRLSNVKSDIVV